MFEIMHSPQQTIERNLPFVMWFHTFEAQATCTETLPICVVLNGVWVGGALEMPHPWQVDGQPEFCFSVLSACNAHGEAGTIRSHPIKT